MCENLVVVGALLAVLWCTRRIISEYFEAFVQHDKSQTLTFVKRASHYLLQAVWRSDLLQRALCEALRLDYLKLAVLSEL